MCRLYPWVSITWLLVLQGTADQQPPRIIAAIFQSEDYPLFSRIFTKALEELQTNRSKYGIEGRELNASNDLYGIITLLCDEILRINVDALMVVGRESTIRAVNIVAQTLSIPVLGYVLDNHNRNIKVDKPLYLDLRPTNSQLAKGIIEFLANYDTAHQFSLVMEKELMQDGFYFELKKITETRKWSMEDEVIITRKSSDGVVRNQLAKLKDNKSRVNIIHMSDVLARRLFAQVYRLGFEDRDYAWILTEHDHVRHVEKRRSFPIGALSLSMSTTVNKVHIIRDTVELIFRALNGIRLMTFSTKQNCSISAEKRQQQAGKEVYRSILKSSTVSRFLGPLHFDSEGALQVSNFVIKNLVHDGEKMLWREIGYIRDNDVRIRDPIWPIDHLLPSTVNGKTRYRIVTTPVKPFVMEEAPHKDYNECMSDTPCLQVFTKDKIKTMEIIRDFEHGIKNKSNPWELRCCRGLAIDLLNKLSNDLDFEFTLYLAYDKAYGAEINGSWTGMVHDIMESTAHLAVAAFSITRSRLKAIDFTDPYFFSGFSILVADRVRDPHMLAFLEPFSIGVWFAIFVSGSVTALAMALFEWNSPFGLNPWGRKRKQNYTIASGMTMVFSVLFGHTVKTKSPKAWPSKVMQNFWAFAAIFIIASYTANLAAFIAGKNNGVNYSSVYDRRLLDARVGILGGSAVGSFLKRIHPPIYYTSHQFLVNSSDIGIRMLIDGNLDAYLGDYPILDYARAKLDPQCQLKLVGQTFGEDGYGIGLPKNSSLRSRLSEKILEYHQSGFIEDLIEIHFADAQCYKQRMTQEESQLAVQHHAGLFVLLMVGIVIGVFVLLLEHIVFKVLVPYFRATPGNSCWRSSHVLFVSQRLHRIITSAELVSPQDSAKEMIGIMRNMEFARLFQKSTIRKNKLAELAKTKRLNRNFYDIVAKARWMQDLRDNNLVDDSSNANTEIIEIPLRDLCPNVELKALGSTTHGSTSSAETEQPVSDWPCNWQEEWLLPVCDEAVPLDIINPTHDSNSETNTPSPKTPPRGRSGRLQEATMRRVDDAETKSKRGRARVRFADTCSLLNGDLAGQSAAPNNVFDIKHDKRKSSWCEDRKNILSSVARKDQALPVKNRLKSFLWKRPSLQDQFLPSADSGFCIDNITKEELLVMWKTSEVELTKKLDQALREKAKLEAKLAELELGSPV